MLLILFSNHYFVCPELRVRPCCVLLVGDKEEDPLLWLEPLDLLLLMVCTCSRTRCWPDRYWLTDGRASDVSSTFIMAMADFSGSIFVIFFFSFSILYKDGTRTRLEREASELRIVLQ